MPKKSVIHNPCPKCQSSSIARDWTPPPGHDTYLREYECQACHLTFYKRMFHPEVLKGEPELVPDN